MSAYGLLWQKASDLRGKLTAINPAWNTNTVVQAHGWLVDNEDELNAREITHATAILSDWFEVEKKMKDRDA